MPEKESATIQSPIVSFNNGEDVLVQDPKFANVYIREAVHDLEVMTRGNPALRQHVITRVLGGI